jgi:hypothetical protein
MNFEITDFRPQRGMFRIHSLYCVLSHFFTRFKQVSLAQPIKYGLVIELAFSLTSISVIF